MYISTKYLHVFLDIGDALLSSGAEIFRVEDTLNRMGYACGATQMNVFVITSSIVITMEFPEENVRTQTRRIRKTGGNDFEKLEKLNNLSRQFCQNPMSPEELRKVFDQIDKVVPTQTGKLAGSILAAFSFALFYGGNLWDALLAGAPVATDENIITSQGVGTAIDFALKLIEVLISEEKAVEIADSIVYQR